MPIPAAASWDHGQILLRSHDREVQNMKNYRPALAGTAVLAAAAGLIPVSMLEPAASASAAGYPAASLPECLGTSLVAGRFNPSNKIRVPTTTNGSGNWHCSLVEGDHNIAVSRLQIGLDAGTKSPLDGCFVSPAHITVDGIYGSHTKAAVSHLQRFWAISVDGMYGPVTAEHINWPVAGTFSARCSNLP